MSLTDRRSFLRARKRLRSHSAPDNRVTSDAFEMDSSDPDKCKKKKRKSKGKRKTSPLAGPSSSCSKKPASEAPAPQETVKKGGKRKSKKKVVETSTDEAMPSTSRDYVEPVASLQKQLVASTEKSITSPKSQVASTEKPVASAEKPEEKVCDSGEDVDSSPRSPSPPPKAGEDGNPSPRSPTPPPKAGEDVDSSPRSPTPPAPDTPVSSGNVLRQRVRYPGEVHPQPEMILDDQTGEMRVRRADDDMVVSPAEDSDIDEDAVEDDDFYERGYPSEHEDSASEDEVPAPAAEAEKSVWESSAETDIFEFPEFDEDVGPTFAMPDDKEVGFFFKFIPESLIRLAAKETNSYASYHQRYIAKKPNVHWRRTNFNEMQAFIGMIICMGVDRKTALEDYWSSDKFLHNAGIASVMVRSRFQMLMRYFHLADPASDPRRELDEEVRRRRCEADPLYKINPWLEPIVGRCVENYQMGQEICIDEGMVRFKGRSKFKQRLPHKPDRDGFKVWQVCDSKTSYIANFSPYLGVKYKSRPDGKKQERGTVKKITMELVAPFTGVNHILFCDSLFTSVNTAMELMELDIYMVGSFNRRNRRSMPPQLIPAGKRKRLPLKFGEMRAATMTDVRINITAYQDSSAQVLILNTVYQPLETVAMGEGDRAAEIPLSLHHYRFDMGGVDRSNQKRKYYHTGRKNNRWWTYLACYLIDVAIVNSYICYQQKHTDTKLTHKFFQLAVGKQLIGGFSSRLQASSREIVKTVVETQSIRPENLHSHVVVRLPGRQKTCKQCAKEGKRTATGRQPETSKGCELCHVHLHEGECFTAFHHAVIFRGKRSVGTQTTSSPTVRVARSRTVAKTRIQPRRK